MAPKRSSGLFRPTRDGLYPRTGGETGTDREYAAGLVESGFTIR
jgi:hypothetical protein